MAETKRMDFSRYPRRDLARDQLLFAEGEATRELYILMTGSLAIYRRGLLVTTIEEPLSIVGELSALTSGLRGASVRALSQCKLVVVADPDAMFEEYPQMGAKLARLLAGRLEAMNGKFVELRATVERFVAERRMNESPEISSSALAAVIDPQEAVTEPWFPAVALEEEPTMDLPVDAVVAAMTGGDGEAIDPANVPTHPGGSAESRDEILDALNAILVNWNPESI